MVSRLVAFVAMGLLSSSAIAAQQELRIPVEPFGNIVTAAVAERQDAGLAILSAQSAGTQLQHLFILSPGIADQKGSLASTASGGYAVSHPSGRGLQAVLTYGNVGLEDASADFDLFNLKAKGTVLSKRNKYSVAAVLEQRHLSDSYNRTKIAGAVDSVFADIGRTDMLDAKFTLRGAVNVGFARKTTISDDVTSDNFAGIGLLAGFPRQKKLTVGLDYRFKNDVEGKATTTLTFVHAVGDGSLSYGVDRTGTISVSYLMLF